MSETILAVFTKDSKPNPFNNNVVENFLSLSRTVKFDQEKNIRDAINDARQQLFKDEKLNKPKLVPLKKLNSQFAHLVEFEIDDEGNIKTNFLGERIVDAMRSPYVWKKRKKDRENKSRDNDGFPFPQNELSKVPNAS